jgi:hypothetical protein
MIRNIILPEMSSSGDISWWHRAGPRLMEVEEFGGFLRPGIGLG